MSPEFLAAQRESNMRRWGFAVAGGAALALLSVLVLSTGAQAAGSGKSVGEPGVGCYLPPCDGSHDIVRVGVGSDGTYLWFFLKHNMAYPGPGALSSAGGAGQVSWYYSQTPPNCYYSKGPAWNVAGTPLGSATYNAAGCGAAGTLVTTATGSLACNEFILRMPLFGVGSPPAGTFLIMGHPSGQGNDLDPFVPVITGTAANQYDYSFTKGSYSIGSNYNIHQDVPALAALQVTGDNQITLTWTQTDNAAQPVTDYQVYRSTTGPAGTFTLMTPGPTGTGTTWTDTGLVSGTNYAYKVSNVNCPGLPAKTGAPGTEPAYTGGESFRSTVQSITPDFKPATPTGLTVATDTSTTLKLTWTASAYDCPNVAPCAPPGTGYSGVKGYAIYRIVGPAPPAIPVWVKNVASDSTVCTGTACQWIDTGLSTGTNYCYVIRAYDGYQMVSPFTPPAAEPTLPNMSPTTSPEQCKIPAGSVSAPTCSAAPATVNTGVSTTFTGALGDGTFSWSGGETPPDQSAGTGTFTTAYLSAGTKTVTVTSATLTGTCTVTVTAPSVPTCSAAPATVVTGQDTVFTGASGNGMFSWTGGGTPATQAAGAGTFTTQYSTAGTKTVTVTSGFQSSTCTVTVNLPGPPTCVASPLTVAVGQTTVISGSSGNGAFTWSGGETPATTGFGVTFSTSYSTTGTKTVTVTSASQNSTCQVTVQPNQPPISRFSASPTTVRVGEPVTFVDASNDPDGNAIMGWSWNFGDGYVASSRAPGHIYGIVGTYNACLVASDSLGVAGDNFCSAITVVAASGSPGSPPGPGQGSGESNMNGDETDDDNKLLVTIQGASFVLPGTMVELTAAAPGAQATTWSWTQTHGSRIAFDTTTSDTVSFVAPTVATTLYIEVEAKSGSRIGRAGIMVEVRIENHAPAATIQIPSAPPLGALVSLDASMSSDEDGDALSFQWTQWEGPAATLSDAASARPSFAMTESGTYRFAVEVSDGIATSVAIQTVTTGDLPPTFVFAVQGFTAPVAADGIVTATPLVSAESYEWDFGDGSPIVSSDGPQPVTHQYAAPGNYQIRMTANDALGASGQFEQEASVGAVPADAAPQDASRIAAPGGGGNTMLWVIVGVASAAIAIAIGVSVVMLRRRSAVTMPSQ